MTRKQGSPKPDTTERLWLLAPAVIAFVGVLVGALVAGGATYYLESRADARELQQAKRLVALEVRANAYDLTFMAVRKKTVGPGHFPEQTWKRYAPLLARGLSRGDWDAVSAFYVQLKEYRDLNNVLGQERPLLKPHRELLPKFRRDAEQVLRRLGAEPTGLLKLK